MQPPLARGAGNGAYRRRLLGIADVRRQTFAPDFRRRQRNLRDVGGLGLRNDSTLDQLARRTSVVGDARNHNEKLLRRILVARHISLTSRSSSISAHEVFTVYAHLLVASYSFRIAIYHLDLVLSTFQLHGSGTPCLFALANPSHSLSCC